MARGPTAKAKAASTASITKTLVLDVGAHSIKAGYASLLGTPSIENCHVIQNCIAYSARDKRTYIGRQMDECMDFGELAVRRPVEKGYIVNWESEKVIWESSILNDEAHGLASDPSETNLILTEAPQAPTALQRHADEMVFEEFGFANYARILAPTLPAYNNGDAAAECLYVIDIGHSHTTFTPLLSGRPLHSACRRLDVGGKVLTNQLKDLISTRQLEMQKEFPLVEQIKEDTCYVVESAQAFADQLDGAWKGGLNDSKPVDTDIVVEYMLPDYEAIKRGFICPHDPSTARDRRLGLNGRPHQFFVVLGNERFAVPELLFSPMDIGMQSPGVAGMILDSLESLPKGMWQPFLANILVVGGTGRLPGLVDRLQSELRQSLDERFMVNVRLADDPLRCVWNGGAQIASSEPLMKHFAVSKAEYLENGDSWLRRVFAGKVVR